MKDEVGIMRAIQIVGAYLDAEFIVEGCRENRMMGCASCEAVDLRDKLAMLAHEIMDDAHHRYPAPPDGAA